MEINMKTYKKFLIHSLVAAVGSSATIALGADKPNIIFILVDDMGYSDIGCYGGEIKTPNLIGWHRTESALPRCTIRRSVSRRVPHY